MEKKRNGYYLKNEHNTELQQKQKQKSQIMWHKRWHRYAEVLCVKNVLYNIFIEEFK